MFRPKTQREQRQEQEAIDKQAELKWQAEKSKYLNSDYVHLGDTKAAVRSYQVQKDIREAEERHEQWKEEQEAREKQSLQDAIAAAKAQGNLVDVSTYYNTAMDYYHGTNGQRIDKPLAAQTFWKALICGDGRAAFDLFQMLYNGDGIAQNQELGKIMYCLSFQVKDLRIQPYKGTITVTDTYRDQASSMSTECKKAGKLFVDGLNDSLLAVQTEIFDNIMRTDKFTTNLYHYTLSEYLVTVDALPQEEVYLAGHSEEASGYDCCTIL